MTDTLADKVLQAVQDYEQDWQQKLAVAEKRIQQLEQENVELQAQVEEDESPWTDFAPDILHPTHPSEDR